MAEAVMAAAGSAAASTWMLGAGLVAGLLELAKAVGDVCWWLCRRAVGRGHCRGCRQVWQLRWKTSATPGHTETKSWAGRTHTQGL